MSQKTIFFIAALLAAPAWAVHKCTGIDGKVSFQDAPCTSGSSEQIDVRPATGPARAVMPRAGTTPVVLPPAPVPALPVPPAPAAPVPAAKSPLDREAEECLNWYRPLLRDPAGAYYTAPSKDRRTVTITIHATNGYGGYVLKSAQCDFNQGALDGSWTKIRAKDLRW